MCKHACSDLRVKASLPSSAYSFLCFTYVYARVIQVEAITNADASILLVSPLKLKFANGKSRWVSSIQVFLAGCPECN